MAADAAILAGRIRRVFTRRLLHQPKRVRGELPRRILVAVLLAPLALVPGRCTWLLAPRWQFAYSLGFVQATFGWHRPSPVDRGPALTIAVPPGIPRKQRRTSAMNRT